MEVKTKYIWREPVSRDSVSETPIEQVLVETESKFQNLKIVQLKGFGKTLICDHFVQSAQQDEYLYHEALVHPAMFLHKCPKTVFLGGGGEGATLREVLKHKSVEKVVMVDIDKDLVDLSRKHLPEWSQGAFDDPRVELYYEDARNYLLTCTKEKKQSFDVIIMDICDPTNDSLAVKLYEKEFYEGLVASQVLNPGFVIVQQSGPCSLTTIKEVFSPIHHTLSQVFKKVIPYSTYINSFFDCWGFNIAINAELGFETSSLDFFIRMRLKENQKVYFYDAVTHLGMFGFPLSLRNLLKEEDRVITEKTPLYMNSGYEEETGKIIIKTIS